jgi:putative methionine-R-sulfoxide reductase with GAF domain
VNDPKNRLALDEHDFAKLIEAAFVLQEHNRDMRLLEESLELHSERLRQQEEAEAQAALPNHAPPADTVARETDYTLTLAEIVEAQNQIQIRHLEKNQAMAVVAERITRIAKASGAGIAILEDKTVRYHAGAGPLALPVGSEAPLAKAICATCLRTGQVLRTPDVNTEFLFDPDLCRIRGILSLVAVPVYHNGEIVGALELYFDKFNGFAEQDIHTCQLMAGLVTEAIGREAEASLKKSMAAERSSMMAAIEQLTPSLVSITAEENAAAPWIDAAPPAETKQPATCWKCASRLIEDEPFCGSCGAPRVGDIDASSLQSKVASAWHSQQAHPEGVASPSTPTASLSEPLHSIDENSDVPPDLESAGDRLSRSLIDSTMLASTIGSAQELEPEPEPEPASSSIQPFASPENSETYALLPVPATELEAFDPAAESAPNGIVPSDAAQPAEADQAWSSAAKARDFLEGLSGTGSPTAFRRFWRARRGDFYLAMALVLVIIVARWGIISRNSTSAPAAGPAKAARHLPTEPDLPLIDRLLINLGLAEAPPTPEDKGNPDTRVWVDLHTALYYCPGSELYGKTPGGRFSTQKEAQLDQFEPASRKACD